MRPSASTFRVLRSLLSGCLLGVVGSADRADAEENPLVIRAVEGLRFDPPRLGVELGREIRLQFENADTTAQPHNLVIARPGSREAVLAAALALGADGPARGFVPASDDVIAASRLLAAGESETLTVRLPGEPGVYPLICTFPGHGILMFGALYSGINMPREPDQDPHIPKSPPTTPIDPDPRPMIRRIFLPDASPAAIAIALPGQINLCWDAGPCRLRYAWPGEFLHAEDHFQGKGQAIARPAGPVTWTTPDQPLVRVSGRPPKAVRFRGYSLDAGFPTFDYSIDDQLVSEVFSMRDDCLIRRFHIPNARAPIELTVTLAPGPDPSVSTGIVSNGVLHLSPSQAADVTLSYSLPIPWAPTPAAK
jgi:azurin